MENIYLEKVASLYDYWKDVTGKEHHDLKARKHHLERALANKDTPESLSKKIHSTGRRMYRARAQGALGLAATATTGVIAAKKYSDRQNEIAAQNMKRMMVKSAGVKLDRFWSTIRESSKPIKVTGRAVFRTGNLVFKSGVDKINTAHGGKVKEYGAKVFGVDTPDFKKFSGSSSYSQLRQAYRKGAKAANPKSGSAEYRKFKRTEGGKAALRELSDLHKKQRVAKVGVYATVGASGAAYVKGKKTGRVESNNYRYY